jgi:hypothetical protein
LKLSAGWRWHEYGQRHKQNQPEAPRSLHDRLFFKGNHGKFKPLIRRRRAATIASLPR